LLLLHYCPLKQCIEKGSNSVNARVEQHNEPNHPNHPKSPQSERYHMWRS
jgi:hypothetical protein